MFDWTSFGTGFAKAGSEKLDKDEEDAKALGAAQVKSLYENYASVVKENRTLSNDIREKINVIKGFAPNATDDQLVALAQDRGVLDMLSTRLKEKDFDATGFNINNFVTVKKASDSGLSAEERIDQLFTIPSAVDSASKAFTSLTPEPAKQGFLSLITGSREGQTRASAEQTALALGVPLEKLQGAMGYRRDIKPSGASYDLVALKPGETTEQMRDKAGVAYAKALKKGDPKEIELTKAFVDITNKAKDALSDDQTRWVNNIARLKGLQVKGTPAQKEAATKELDAIFAEEKKAEEAKQLPKAQRENMIAKLEIDAASDDPKVAESALAQLIKEASNQAKVAEAKQTKTQQRDNYLADLELKARGKLGTPAEQEEAKTKLIDIAKLDKVIADYKLGDVAQREAALARLKDQAKDPDPTKAAAALTELKQVSAIDAAIKEAGNTSVEKLAATKAQLVIDAANGNKEAEAKLQAFFAVDKLEAEAKQGAAQKRKDYIEGLKTDAAADKPGAKALLDKELAVDIAAKKAEAEATKGAAQQRTDRLAELATAAGTGDAVAQAQYNRELAIDDAAKVAEKEALKGDAQQRTDRLAALRTIITTSTDKAKVKEAQAEFNRELKLIAAEARAGNVEKTASDKVPNLGSLSSLAGVAAAQAVLDNHGNQKNNMVIIDKVGSDGVAYKDYEYNGGDAAIAAQIKATKAAAVKNAMSVFTDNKGVPLNRDVQAILNVWVGSTAAPEKKGGLGSRPAAEAAPAPAAAAAASNTTTTGSGASTVVIVTDKEGKQFKFEGADAARRATGFKEAKGLK